MQALNSSNQNKTGKSVFKAIFLVLAWLIIVSLAKDALHIEKGFDRVSQATSRLEQEEVKNAELVAKYENVRTEEYRERLIREQLNMQKEGEVVAVLPKRGVVGDVPSDSSDEELPNWEKWLNLLL